MILNFRDWNCLHTFIETTSHKVVPLWMHIDVLKYTVFSIIKTFKWRVE